MKKILIILFTLFSLGIKAQCKDTILVPNAFTPLGIKNQVFYPFIEPYKDYTLSIYNRWGNLIYYGKEWNGYYKGSICESGIYIWSIKAINDDCEKYFNGTILLIK
jgi:gliding motility-associated-like protein